MRRRKAGENPRGRRWGRWLAVFILIGALVPVLQVATVRFFNPPVTPLMLLREAEARWASGPIPARQYHWLPLTEMPREFLKFIFISEDQRFFQHHGFDWREVELAQKQAQRTRSKARGASTISMQCARSLFLWQGRSWVRKGLEAYYTFWMEALLSKTRILELYANVIEMGDGVYGIEAAARAHFGVKARELSAPQCAALAAILPNPRRWNPRDPSAKVAARIAKIRRQEHAVTFPSPAPRKRAEAF